MPARHLELGLITTLALGLGYSLASNPAIGYPAGAAVSLGTNPVVSSGGSLSVPYSSSASGDLITAPADQDLIITDLVVDAGSTSQSCLEQWLVSVTEDGGRLASTTVSPRFRKTSSYNYSADHNFEGSSRLSLQSGIRIPAGATAQIEASTITYTDCSSSRSAELFWTVSGYYAQP